MKTFFVVWAGQLVSIVGSSLTGFALAIWVYQETGSVTMLAMVMVAATVPGIVIAPFAGALVDRWDRRTVMLASDTAAGLATGAVAWLLFTGHLSLGPIYLLVLVGSVAGAFQEPAWTASIPMLVPKRHLGRANGLAQTGQAVGHLVAPLLAGALLVTTGLWGVLLVDFATFIVAVVTVASVRIPRPERTRAIEPVVQEARDGWRYLRVRSGLLGLLVVMSTINFLFGFVNVLFVPLFLSFTNELALGTAFSVAGIGMLLGTLLMGAWGGPRRRVRGMLGLLAAGGVLVAAAGLRAAVVPVTAALFGFMLLIPVINGTSQALWQLKVDLDMQGRVFALRRMFAQAAAPVSYLLAGPLADRVFEPLMSGPLAASVGAVIGTGEGRGIALMFILMGLALSAVAAAGYLYRPIRDLETDLPDAAGLVEDPQADVRSSTPSS